MPEFSHRIARAEDLEALRDVMRRSIENLQDEFLTPEQVKQIICESCTDLGRERYFQGSGMVDVLRAIQAV